MARVQPSPVSADSLLVITTSYPVGGDGSEAAGSFVADMVEEAAQHVSVRVVAPGRREDVDEQGCVKVWRFSAGSAPLSLLSPTNPFHWPSIGRTLASLRRQTLAASADGRVGHALALWVLPSGWAARVLHRAKGVPYSVWALGSDIWTLGRVPVARQVLRRVCLDAEHRFADGFGLAADAGVLAGRQFSFLPSCRRMSPQRSAPVSTAPPYRLLFLGRWHPNKGVDLLLDALTRLGDPEWQLIQEVHIAGGGPLERVVMDAIESLRAEGRPVRLSGYLDRTQAARALGEADRLLLPSRVESIPVVFSDALAFDLPIVATPVGDLPMLLAEGGGWLAAETSAPAFLVALRECLQAGPVRQMAPELRSRFSQEAVAGRLARLVKSP